MKKIIKKKSSVTLDDLARMLEKNVKTTDGLVRTTDGLARSVDKRFDAADEKFESLARMVQKGFSEMATKTEMRAEFKKVHEHLIELDDSVSYPRQSVVLLTGDLGATKRRLTRVEEKLGMKG